MVFRRQKLLAHREKFNLPYDETTFNQEDERIQDLRNFVRMDQLVIPTEGKQDQLINSGVLDHSSTGRLCRLAFFSTSVVFPLVVRIQKDLS
jgi:hypothetical protein